MDFYLEYVGSNSIHNSCQWKLRNWCCL